MDARRKRMYLVEELGSIMEISKPFHRDLYRVHPSLPAYPWGNHLNADHSVQINFKMTVRKYLAEVLLGIVFNL